MIRPTPLSYPDDKNVKNPAVVGLGTPDPVYTVGILTGSPEFKSLRNVTSHNGVDYVDGCPVFQVLGLNGVWVLYSNGHTVPYVQPILEPH